jgi:glycosyltransferase involved in cell wall biosynthesis
MTRLPENDQLLTVLVPCFNEQEGIGPTVAGIMRHAPSLPLPVQVLLIDDGSTDTTREQITALAAEYPEVLALTNDQNLGMGRSVIKAYDHIAPGSWVTVMPGDNELAFESIDNYLAVRDRYDIVLGYLQNPVIRTLSRRLASWCFTKVVSTLYGFPWRYLNGLKMYRLEAFKDLEVVSGGHAFMAEMLAKAQLRRPELCIGEVPFYARGRARGSSKAIRIGSVLRAVGEVVKGARSVARYRRAIVREGPLEG